MTSTASLKFGNLYVSEDRLDPIILQIRDELLAGKSRKQVANKYKMNFEYVCKIYKRFNIGQSINKNGNPSSSESSERKGWKQNENGEPYFDKPVEETTVTPYEGGKSGLSDDQILYIVEQREAGKSAQDIATELNISENTVYRYSREFGVKVPSRRGKKKKVEEKRKEEVKGEEVKEEVKDEKVMKTEETDTGATIDVEEEKKKTDVIVEIPLNEPTVEIGLVADRHDMPVERYIFNRVTSTGMFDYDELEKTANKFIDTHIPFIDKDGEPVAQKSLTVLVTGLTCCVAAICKVTNERKVNLTLKHFNHEKKTYNEQVIWNQFGVCGDNHDLKTMFYNTNKLYTLCCEPSDISDQPFFAVKLIDFSSDVRYCEEYISTSLTPLVWETYNKLCMEHINYDDPKKRIAVYLQQNRLYKGKEVGVKLISRSSNFDENYGGYKWQ